MPQFGRKADTLQVAIVGSGPSGFYAAEALSKCGRPVNINLIEKLPTPFGLVRYGVAPDHPKLKQVSLVFDKIARSPNLHYFGNVEVGRDITLEELKATHHAVILCNGADTDRSLGLPGEDLTGSHTATEFVAWYNGHPDYKDYEFDLSAEVAVVIGQGNVAADVCRILAKPVDELCNTDIAQHALDQLAKSKVRDIHLIGRRSPAQAKFTSKELKELGELTGCETSVDQAGFVLEAEDHHELADITKVNAAKCVEHFKHFGFTNTTKQSRNLLVHFLLSPIEIIGGERVEKITFNRNRLKGIAFSRVAEPTGDTIEIDCGLCFRSIGYRGQPLENVPFDARRNVFFNDKGRVLDLDGKQVPQLYTSGWIKRGPSGIIGTNRADSLETIASVQVDLDGLLSSRQISDDSFALLVEKKNINAISYDQWHLIDSAEIQRGLKAGKPREKFTDINQMLAIGG